MEQINLKQFLFINIIKFVFGSAHYKRDLITIFLASTKVSSP